MESLEDVPKRHSNDGVSVEIKRRVIFGRIRGKREGECVPKRKYTKRRTFE